MALPMVRVMSSLLEDVGDWRLYVLNTTVGNGLEVNLHGQLIPHKEIFGTI